MGAQPNIYQKALFNAAVMCSTKRLFFISKTLQVILIIIIILYKLNSFEYAKPACCSSDKNYYKELLWEICRKSAQLIINMI